MVSGSQTGGREPRAGAARGTRGPQPRGRAKEAEDGLSASKSRLNPSKSCIYICV